MGFHVIQALSFLFKMIWQARRDSNPQHPDLESDALPLELLACIIFIIIGLFGLSM
jgi:hypothetical protein